MKLNLFIPLLFSSCQPISHWVGSDEIVLDKAFIPQGGQSAHPEQSFQYCLLTYRFQKQQKPFPLLVALHGAGGNGRDYLEFWQEEARRHHFMILAPTYGKDRDLDPQDLFPLINDVLTKYAVDQHRIFLVGSSAGAYAARILVEENPSLWRGAIFVSAPFAEKAGAGRKWEQLPPVLFVHGKKDIYKIKSIIESVKLLRRHGVQAELIVDPKAGHGVGSEWNGKIFKWIQWVETHS